MIVLRRIFHRHFFLNVRIMYSAHYGVTRSWIEEKNDSVHALDLPRFVADISQLITILFAQSF